MFCFHAAQTGKHLLRTKNVSEQNQKHFFVPDTEFVSATNVARAGKRGNICFGNNVSAIMCPRLPGPLEVPFLTQAHIIDHTFASTIAQINNTYNVSHRFFG